jgi:rod shape-determining protein MreC
MSLVPNRPTSNSNVKSLLKLVWSLVRKFIAVFFVAIAFILLLASLNSVKIIEIGRAFTDQLIKAIVLPVNKVSISINSSKEFLSELLEARRENIILKQKLALLEKSKEENIIIKSENIKLKDLLSFVKEQEYQFISARLLATTPGPFVKSAIISAGSNHGIEKEQVVLNDKGVIGRVIEVKSEHSRILFVNDFNSRIPVITSISRERCILAGNNSNQLELLYLPENTQIRDSELIITSGDGKYYPPGLPVARIVKNGKNNAYALPFLDIKSLEFVSIIKNNKHNHNG